MSGKGLAFRNENHTMDDESSDSGSGDDWAEIEETQSFICLFCSKNCRNRSSALRHLQGSHNFSISRFQTKHALDMYSYIKLINFIRKKNVSPEDLKVLSNKAWDKDEFLTPIIQDDAWLMLDIDDLQEETTKPVVYPVNSDNGRVTLSEIHFAELQRTIQSLKAELDQRELACLLANQKVEEMKQYAHRLILDDGPAQTKERSVKSISCDIDDKGYFNTYSHFAIHHEMLTDKVRTESYRDALLMNSHIFKNCVMMDVGCGTGILSMFAAKSGCRKVISIDQSEVIYQAMDIVRENNLEDIITLRKGRLEDIEVGEEKVDAIVSEWMGYFLLFEGMLDTIVYARDHYLSPGGKLLPNRCTLSLVGSGDTKRYVDLVDYWSNVYGFKMSCMKAEVVREASIEVCNAQELITSVAQLESFDLYTVSTDCVNFSTPFELLVKKTGSLTALVGYFDVFFDLDNPISFSTGPQATPTHWKQTVFSLSEPISISEGETVSGKLICRRHAKDVRGLVVTIQINNSTQVYYLD